MYRNFLADNGFVIFFEEVGAIYEQYNKTGLENLPLEISVSKILPGPSCLSAPITNITSARPARIFENAENTALDPELQRFSTEYA